MCGDGAQVVRAGGLGGGGRVPGRKWSRNAAGRDFDSGRWGDQAARNLLRVDRDQALIGGLPPSNCDLFLRSRPCIPRYIIYKCAYFSLPNNFTYNHVIWE